MIVCPKIILCVAFFWTNYATYVCWCRGGDLLSNNIKVSNLVKIPKYYPLNSNPKTLYNSYFINRWFYVTTTEYTLCKLQVYCSNKTVFDVVFE